ncbi:hypothetical protein GALL_478370 [mine drainage metagenome]|uniref:Uncharacterized protein n=1 Tax=mine drainage metagenome TaxID=410659 RepID=A0A1J5PGJ9_9ZZZZ
MAAFDTKDGACGVQFYAQAAGRALVGEGKFERMHADAVGFVQRAVRFGVHHIVPVNILAGQHAGVITEDLAHDLAFVAQESHFLIAMGDIQMPSGLRLALGKFGEQRFEGFEAFADFLVESQRGGLAPALDPLRAIKPAAGILALAAVAAGTAPRGLVGFQHRGADAVLTGEEQGRGKTGEAGTDDRDVDVEVVGYRPVVLRRGAGAGDPVGRCVIRAAARSGVDQGVVAGFVRVQHGAGGRRNGGIHERVIRGIGGRPEYSDHDRWWFRGIMGPVARKMPVQKFPAPRIRMRRRAGSVRPINVRQYQAQLARNAGRC